MPAKRTIPVEPWVEILSTIAVVPSSEPRHISECFDPATFDVFSPNGERWAVERTGEREQILWPLRLAVALRDNFTCRYCHVAAYPDIEIDHVVPWSAGGPDRSWNLRVLCSYCNQMRSNRRDGTEHRRQIPVTWWCLNCWSGGLIRYRDIWRTGHDMNIGHEVTQPMVSAFCAFCRSMQQTDVTL